MDENRIEQIVEEANRCLHFPNPMCQKGCPLENNIPQMIAEVKKQNFEEAYKIDQETNPLGYICGVVCPHEKQCEGQCIRGLKEKPVQIGMIESFVCESKIKKLEEFKVTGNEASPLLEKREPAQILQLGSQSSKVAIIGGGPAGLACAYFLSKQNIKSTIFEKENYLGRNFNIWNSRF